MDSIDDLVSRGGRSGPRGRAGRLLEQLQRLDPSLQITGQDGDEIELTPRGRSGASIRLGPITHEVFVPDWHEGEAGPPVVDSRRHLAQRVPGG